MSPDRTPGDPGTDPVRVVVVGFGMAGGRLVEELLARAGRDGRPPVAVTVVGAEPYPAYNRVLLSDVVGGRADVASLATVDVAALQAQGVRLLTGVAATGIDRGRRVLTCDDGTELGYDALVLATGARAVVPPVLGLEGALAGGALPAGVHVLRTVDDAREIVAAAANARSAVVVGGGLLGLEAGRGLARRVPSVTVLHRGEHLLERQLDKAGARVLARCLQKLGVHVRTSAATTAAHLDADGRLHAVSADIAGEAQHLDCDLLLLSCGVRPDTALAATAGLRTARGIVVDDQLRTDDPAVFAIGDCAEHDGRTPGLVATAWDQARTVAELITGADPQARYRHVDGVVRLKAADLDVAVAGHCRPGPWDDEPGLEVVQLLDPAGGRYVKAVVRDGRVCGAAVVGDPRAAAELSRQVDAGALAPRDRTALLTPGRRSAGTGAGDADPTLIPDRATVCRCNGVTKKALVDAWGDGARTVEALGRRTRAGTGCGTCTDTLSGLLAWLARADPDAAAPPPTAAPRDAVPADPLASGTALAPSTAETPAVTTAGGTR